MRHAFRGLEIATGLERGFLRRVDFVTHAEVHGAGDHRHVFVRGMHVRRHLVAGRRLDAQDERAFLPRIAGDDGKLRPLRITGWGGTPLERVGRRDDVLVGGDCCKRQQRERS